MKYHAFLPNFGSVGGWLEGSWIGWVLVWVVVGGWCGGGVLVRGGVGWLKRGWLWCGGGGWVGGMVVVDRCCDGVVGEGWVGDVGWLVVEVGCGEVVGWWWWGTVAGVLTKNIFISLPILKLSLTLPHKGKMLWCSYFRSFIKLTNFLRTGNFVEKFNFVSTSWKIKIPKIGSKGQT